MRAADVGDNDWAKKNFPSSRSIVERAKRVLDQLAGGDGDGDDEEGGRGMSIRSGTCASPWGALGSERNHAVMARLTTPLQLATHSLSPRL